MNTVSSEKRKYEMKARAEAQEATRARIAAAASELHGEVGVAKTTVADIARRAGVQRLTVYNHFPDLAALLPVCSAHWLDEHPLPDLGPAFAAPDPAERLRGVLALLYGWYRENQAMQRNLLSDRASVPEVDVFFTQTSDVLMAELADALAAGFERPSARPAVALALDFWTWQRLDREGLDPDPAATLMAAMVGCGS